MESLQKQYILFDMDGVLINTEPLQFKIWKEVFSCYGLDIDYEIYKGCIGSTLSFLLELLYNGYGTDLRNEPGVREHYKRIRARYIEEGTGFPPVEGVPEVIRYLKEKGYRMAVASSSPQYIIEAAMEHLGIADCFDLLFSGERVAHPKPAPDVFLETASRMNADPKDCLVIEDSRNGSLAAVRAGMVCYGFPNPDSGVQDLSAAEKIFYPFSELKKLL